MQDTTFRCTVLCPYCLRELSASHSTLFGIENILDKKIVEHMSQVHPANRRDQINWTPEVEELRHELQAS